METNDQVKQIEQAPQEEERPTLWEMIDYIYVPPKHREAYCYIQRNFRYLRMVVWSAAGIMELFLTPELEKFGCSYMIQSKPWKNAEEKILKSTRLPFEVIIYDAYKDFEDYGVFLDRTKLKVKREPGVALGVPIRHAEFMDFLFESIQEREAEVFPWNKDWPIFYAKLDESFKHHTWQTYVAHFESIIAESSKEIKKRWAPVPIESKKIFAYMLDRALSLLWGIEPSIATGEGMLAKKRKETEEARKLREEKEKNEDA